MTCRELGGACDLEFHAGTFDEMARMSQKHGQEMARQSDKPHLEAMRVMRDLMQTEAGMAAWMAEKRQMFDSRAESMSR